MKRGFNIPLETVSEEKQEELEAAVEDWNMKHFVKCEYPLNCVVSRVLCEESRVKCTVYSVMFSEQW